MDEQQRDLRPVIRVPVEGVREVMRSGNPPGPCWEGVATLLAQCRVATIEGLSAENLQAVLLTADEMIPGEYVEWFLSRLADMRAFISRVGDAPEWLDALEDGICRSPVGRTCYAVLKVYRIEFFSGQTELPSQELTEDAHAAR